MLYRDQKKIKKLKRRIVLLIFLLSASIYWSVVKYHEHQFTIGENEMLFNELITTQSERDSLIRVLKQQTPKLEETKQSTKPLENELLKTYNNINKKTNANNSYQSYNTNETFIK